MWYRVALGFPTVDIPVTRWGDYRGHDTPEGRSLNESAIEAGDDPDDWYVSEQEIDVMKVAEFWSSRSVSKPRLERVGGDYVSRIRRMVTGCREARAKGQGVYIPPAWMDLTSPEKQRALSQALKVTNVTPCRGYTLATLRCTLFQGRYTQRCTHHIYADGTGITCRNAAHEACNATV
jgi:hypothetical protein